MATFLFGLLCVSVQGIGRLGEILPQVASAESSLHYDGTIGLKLRSELRRASEISAFLSRDPFEGTLRDPMTRHPYMYAHNDPINNVDPSGLLTIGGVISAGSIGNTLDEFYNASVIESGLAVQTSLMGVQAGKRAEAILVDYVVESAIAAVGGYALSKILGRALDLDSTTRAVDDAALDPQFVPVSIPRGTKVFRVIGPNGNPLGRSWTTIDPRAVKNYTDAAGLPLNLGDDIDSGRAKLVVGEIKESVGIGAGPAENSINIPREYGGGTGNAGGIFELRFDPITIDRAVEVKEIIPF